MPGVLETADIPDLVAALGRRAVLLEDAADAGFPRRKSPANCGPRQAEVLFPGCWSTSALMDPAFRLGWLGNSRVREVGECSRGSRKSPAPGTAWRQERAEMGDYRRSPNWQLPFRFARVIVRGWFTSPPANRNRAAWVRSGCSARANAG
jgi:hypothetical protein